MSTDNMPYGLQKDSKWERGSLKGPLKIRFEIWMRVILVECRPSLLISTANWLRQITVSEGSVQFYYWHVDNKLPYVFEGCIVVCLRLWHTISICQQTWCMGMYQLSKRLVLLQSIRRPAFMLHLVASDTFLGCVKGHTFTSPGRDSSKGIP